MKYNAKYDRWFTKGGLVFRYDEKQDKLVECKQQLVRGYLKFTGSNSSECPNPRFVHRAIWETFNDEIPKGQEIDHIDGNRSNNNLKNLQCVTHIKNMANPNFRIRRKLLNTQEYIEKQKKAITNKPKPRSEFGIKYYAHFGQLIKTDIAMHMREYRYYKQHGRCRWEVLDEHN